MFEPVSSGWGRLGSTVIRLDVADRAMVNDALATAWRNVADAPDVAKSTEATVADAGNVVDVTESADAADIGNVVHNADVAEAAEAVDIVDAARLVIVEPYDHLKSVIERLLGCW